jgi:hypothetical protein
MHKQQHSPYMLLDHPSWTCLPARMSDTNLSLSCTRSSTPDQEGGAHRHTPVNLYQSIVLLLRSRVTHAHRCMSIGYGTQLPPSMHCALSYIFGNAKVCQPVSNPTHPRAKVPTQCLLLTVGCIKLGPQSC